MIPPTSSPSDPPDPDLSSLERPRAGGRRVLWISLGVSAVLHGVAIVLYAVFMGRLAPAPLPLDASGTASEPRGTEVIRLVAVPDDEAPPEDEPEVESERPTPVPPAPEPAAGPEVAPSAAAEERPSAAELLRPREEGDERIWRPTDPALLELSPTRIAELRAAGRLQAWSDSVAAAREAERRALDWTHTDDQGRRWGVSPDGIHLGDVTLPVPSFGSKHAESNRRQHEWAEIERGAADAATRYRQEDRARAIRERRNRERAEAKAEAKADTTAGGGR